MSLAQIAASVLMVGHSLFGQDGPDMLQEALRAGTGVGEVRAQIINGAPLRYNWVHSAEAEGVDARAVLPEGGVSDLILTEALPLGAHLKWSQTEAHARAFAELAWAANPQTRVFVQETWHSLKSGSATPPENDPGGDVPWRARLEQDLPHWQGIVAALAGGPGQVALIPAGQAMGRLDDAIRAGEVPGLAGIEALFADDIHLNDTGHYFVAMVQYAVLTGRDPLGLPVDFADRWGQAFDTPDPDLARHLQKIAQQSVVAQRDKAGVPAPAAPKPQPADAAPAQPRAPPAAGAEAQVPAQTGTDGTSPEVSPLAAPAAAEAPAVDTAPVAAALSGVVPDGPVRPLPLGFNLAAVADWSTQVPFLDHMKAARPWIGHLPGRFGGMEIAEMAAGGYLDAAGWPRAMPPELDSIGTLVLTDMPEAAQSLKGRYVLSYQGEGTIEVKGRARNVRYGRNEVRFDYAPGPGSVDIRIQRINRTDPPRNITVVAERHRAAHRAGQLFNPDWLARLEGVAALRFMDWGGTNNATLARWENRPRQRDVTWAGGVPYEVMIALANELGADAWLTVPHLAEDDFVAQMATLVKAELDPARKVYVERSNEVWNWQFDQARHADAAALARWDAKDAWMQYHGMRAAEVAGIWSEVFAGEDRARLVNVIATQTGWLGLEQDILTAPLAEAEGQPAPAEAFDAYAVSGYFGGVLGLGQNRDTVLGWIAESRADASAEAAARNLAGEAAAAYIEAHQYDAAVAHAATALRARGMGEDSADTLADLIGRVWPYHVAVAERYGLHLLVYEGGSHAVGIGAEVDNKALTDFLIYLNYTEAMGGLYAALLNGWQSVGGELFMAYSDVYAPTKWGAWGALRHLDDATPRWQVLREARQ